MLHMSVWYGIVGFNIPLDTYFGDDFMGQMSQPTASLH